MRNTCCQWCRGTVTSQVMYARGWSNCSHRRDRRICSAHYTHWTTPSALLLHSQRSASGRHRGCSPAAATVMWRRQQRGCAANPEEWGDHDSAVVHRALGRSEGEARQRNSANAYGTRKRKKMLEYSWTMWILLFFFFSFYFLCAFRVPSVSFISFLFFSYLTGHRFIQNGVLCAFPLRPLLCQVQV